MARLVFAVLLVVILVIGGWWGWQKLTSTPGQSIFSASPTPISQLTLSVDYAPSPSPVPTVPKDWLTYAEINFNLSLPPDWVRALDGVNIIRFQNFPGSAPDGTFNPQEIKDKLKLDIVRFRTAKNVASFVVQQEQQQRISQPDSATWQKDTMILSGQRAMKVTVASFNGADIYNYYVEIPDKEEILLFSFLLDFQNYQLIRDKIVESIKIKT